jgi:hypothetical protein
VWPPVATGNVVTPTNVEQPKDPKKQLRLKTLSMRPRVFLIENFMTFEEADAMVSLNKPKLKRSTVGATAYKDR